MNSFIRLQDEQLDLGDLPQVDERLRVDLWRCDAGLGLHGSWHRHPIDEVVDDILDGDAVTGGVRSEPDAMAEHVARQRLHVLGIDLGAAVHAAAPTP